MSIAATNWAYRQKIPIKPKFVLAALADQADERTGRVCYGKTDMGFLAEKCSIPERSLYRYLGALIRNGYVIRESGKALGLPSVYWLVLDRAMAETLSEWQWKSVDDPADDEPQDVDEGSAKMAEGEQPEPVSQMAEGVCQPMAEGVCHKVADREPTSEPKNFTRKRAKDDFGFSRKDQDLDRRKLVADEAARKAATQVFVYLGSQAWDAWAAEMTKRRGIRWTLHTTATIDGKAREGWYFPTLFPPKTTGPPPDDPLSDEDVTEFIQSKN